MAKLSIMGIVYTDPLAEGTAVPVNFQTDCRATFQKELASVMSFPAYSATVSATEGQLVMRRQVQRMPKNV